LFKYSVNKLINIAEAKKLGAYAIDFYSRKGRYLYTIDDPFSVAEFFADFDMAVKAVGKDYRKMKEWLNDEHKDTK